MLRKLQSHEVPQQTNYESSLAQKAANDIAKNALKEELKEEEAPPQLKFEKKWKSDGAMMKGALTPGGKSQGIDTGKKLTKSIDIDFGQVKKMKSVRNLNLVGLFDNKIVLKRVREDPRQNEQNQNLEFDAIIEEFEDEVDSESSEESEHDIKIKLTDDDDKNNEDNPFDVLDLADDLDNDSPIEEFKYDENYDTLILDGIDEGVPEMKDIERYSSDIHVDCSRRHGESLIEGRTSEPVKFSSKFKPIKNNILELQKKLTFEEIKEDLFEDVSFCDENMASPKHSKESRISLVNQIKSETYKINSPSKLDKRDAKTFKQLVKDLDKSNKIKNQR